MCRTNFWRKKERKKKKNNNKNNKFDETCKKQHPHLVERNKAKKSESVGQTSPQLPWKQKRGD
jgi:hypothetical protein